MEPQYLSWSEILTASISIEFFIRESAPMKGHQTVKFLLFRSDQVRLGSWDVEAVQVGPTQGTNLLEVVDKFFLKTS